MCCRTCASLRATSGGEGNAVVKDHAATTSAWLLCYPDAYEVGQPNQGIQILYEVLNERADTVAERAFAPWPDMEAVMREEGIPFFSLETHRPARLFDVVAFSLAVRGRVHQPAGLPGPGGHPAARGRSRRRRIRWC